MGMTSDTVSVTGGSGEMVIAKKTVDPEVLQERPGAEGTAVSTNTAKLVQDLARQLDYVTSKCRTVEELFGGELISRRQKLKIACEQYMLESPKVNSASARDKLWRYVYYDVVSKAKRMKQRDNWTILEQVYIKQHLLNGVGQLSFLLLRLQEAVPEFNKVNCRLQVNGLDNILPEAFREAKPQTWNNDETDAGDWVVTLIHLFLLNIGDLCRYLTDFYNKEDQILHLSYYDRAQDYYVHAFLVNPESGLAHNQLGTLSTKRNNGLDSVYYFLYSLVSKTPCHGAVTNLRQLLESKLISFARLSGSVIYEPVDLFCHNLMKILNQFFSETPALLGVFQKLCEDTVGSFVLLLAQGVTSLDDGFLFRVMSICMMTVWHLSTKNTSNSSAAVCFAVGIFVHLMRRLFTILKSHSRRKEVPDKYEEDDASSIETEVAEFMSKSTSSLAPDVKDDTQTATVEVEHEHDNEYVGKRRTLKTQRRHESNDFYTFICQDDNDDWNDNASESTDNLHGSRSSLHSDYTDDTQSDYENHSEEDAYSEDGTDYKTTGNQDSSEASDISYQAEIEIERKAAALKLSQDSEEAVSIVKGGGKPSVKVKDMIEFEDLEGCWAEAEPIIVAVLPFMRWLQCWLPIQNALAASTEKEVMEEFCQILNLLESTNWRIALRQRFDKQVAIQDGFDAAAVNEVEASLAKDWTSVVAGRLDEKLFSMELPEDRSMLGWIHLLSNGNDVRAKCLTKYNMMVTRIGRLLVFGQWLVGTEAFAVIRSDDTFLVPSVEEYKKHMRKIQVEKFSRRLSAKDKDRLDDRGKRERRRGKRNRGFNRRRNGFRDDFALVNQNDRIYILVDLAAFLKYLRVIKKLSMHPKFLIIVPFAVGQALDRLKDSDDDGSKVARIANRWLEGRTTKEAYRNGVQFLRTEDRVSLDNVQYPSIETNESREFFEVLESCIYIRDKMSNQTQRRGKFFKDARDNYRVLYLTGNKDLLDSTLDLDRRFNPVETCRGVYVYLDRISRYQNRSRRRKRPSNGHCGG